MGEYAQLEIGSQYNAWRIIGAPFKNKYGKDSYLCRCECGAEKYVEGRSLVKEFSKSCGCRRRVDPDEQKRRVVEYKRRYFQDNKDRVMTKNSERMKKLRSQDREKYGVDRYNLKSKYGLSIEEYQKMINEQENRCCICGVDFSYGSQWSRPYIDHDHKTGKVRKLLCMNCNAGLGHFKENVGNLLAAIKYLEENNA